MGAGGFSELYSCIGQDLFFFGGGGGGGGRGGVEF